MGVLLFIYPLDNNQAKSSGKGILKIFYLKINQIRGCFVVIVAVVVCRANVKSWAELRLSVRV